MTSVRPWFCFVALGVLAAWLLDAETFAPFFIVWGVAGIVLAVEADNTLKRRERDRDNDARSCVDRSHA